MVCHGELYRLRPAPVRLTGYYLMIALGGAAGGLFVAVIAPLIFSSYFELHCGAVLSALLFLMICIWERDSISTRQWTIFACALTLAGFAALDRALPWIGEYYVSAPKSGVGLLRLGLWATAALLFVSWVARRRSGTATPWRALACTWLSLGVAALAAACWISGRSADPNTIRTSRNFYGVLTVLELNRGDLASRHLILRHGRITHGLQLEAPEQATRPTSYYCQRSGVGLAIQALPPGPRRVAVVGLGAGTLAAYARPGDYFRIYEINPAVHQIASSNFTFLSHCPAKVDVVLGDARLSMEQEPPQHFDLIALDAFNGDAIPLHLLTKEAFDVYGRHLRTNGVLAVHISNGHLDLNPVLVNVARVFGYRHALIANDDAPNQWWDYGSSWVLLTHDPDFLNQEAIRGAASKGGDEAPALRLWTDDFASLFQVLKR
jgi:spermidine synthase